MKKLLCLILFTIPSLSIFSIEHEIDENVRYHALTKITQCYALDISRELEILIFMAASSLSDYEALVNKNIVKSQVFELQKVIVFRSLDELLHEVREQLLDCKNQCILVGAKHCTYSSPIVYPTLSHNYYAYFPSGLAPLEHIFSENIGLCALTKEIESHQIPSAISGSLFPGPAYEKSQCFHPFSSGSIDPGLRFIILSSVTFNHESIIDEDILTSWQEIEKPADTIFYYREEGLPMAIFSPDALVGPRVIIAVECNGNCWHQNILPGDKYFALFTSFGGIKEDLETLRFMADILSSHVQKDFCQK